MRIPFRSSFRSPSFAAGIQSYLAAWSLIRLWNLSLGSLLTVVVWLLLFFFFRTVHELPKDTASAVPGHDCLTPPHTTTVSLHRAGYLCSDRFRLWTAIPALLFSLFCLMARHQTITSGLDHIFFQVILLGISAAGLFLLFFHVLTFLFYHGYRKTLKPESAPIPYLPLAAFVCCLIGWMLYFLTEYPAIMTPDSINQLEQVLGMVPYSNHHPWVHTLLIGLLFRIGSLFSDHVNTALSFFTLFQMCFMASSVSFLICVLQKIKIRNNICILLICFYAFLPYHGIFAVTIWKDVMFAGSVVFFSASLLVMVLYRETTPGRYLFLYTLSGILMCLLRSNGWYAFLFCLPVFLLFFRTRQRKFLLLHGLILSVVLIIKIPVMNTFHVIQPDFAESISIPLQQTARVIAEDKYLTPEEWECIHRVMDTTYLKELYAPGFADNMKELLRAGDLDYLTSHKGEYLKLWLTLGLRYPLTYLQAYIDQTVGYWYPDQDAQPGRVGGIIPSETGAYSQPLLTGKLITKYREILLKLDELIPVYSLLFHMGAMCWLFLGSIALVIIKKKEPLLVILLPGSAILLTLFIATPVSSEFRYAYWLAQALPLYLLLPFLPEEAFRPHDQTSTVVSTDTQQQDS